MKKAVFGFVLVLMVVTAAGLAFYKPVGTASSNDRPSLITYPVSDNGSSYETVQTMLIPMGTTVTVRVALLIDKCLNVELPKDKLGSDISPVIAFCNEDFIDIQDVNMWQKVWEGTNATYARWIATSDNPPPGMQNVPTLEWLQQNAVLEVTYPTLVLFELPKASELYAMTVSAEMAHQASNDETAPLQAFVFNNERWYVLRMLVESNTASGDQLSLYVGDIDTMKQGGVYLFIDAVTGTFFEMRLPQEMVNIDPASSYTGSTKTTLKFEAPAKLWGIAP